MHKYRPDVVREESLREERSCGEVVQMIGEEFGVNFPRSWPEYLKCLHERLRDLQPAFLAKVAGEVLRSL